MASLSMGYRGYVGVAEWDSESGVWRGRVSDIADTVTFQAPVMAIVPVEFRRSVDEYIGFCRGQGIRHDPLPIGNAGPAEPTS